MRPVLWFVAQFCLLVSAGPLSAGVLIIETQRPAGGGAEQETRIFLEDRRIRVETVQGGEAMIVIFDGEQDVFWMLNPGNRTARRMTRADLERLAGQVNDVMAQMMVQMEAQLKNLPPEQRQMIEQMMKQKMPAQAASTPTVYARVRSGETVGQWTCDLYEGRRDGEKRWEICAAEWSELGLTTGQFDVLRDLSEFFSGITRGASEDMFRVGASDTEQGFPGVPVRRVSFRNGAPETEYTVTEVRQETFDPSLFGVPDGYREEPFPGLATP